jgi:hypothetical protein
MIHYQLRCSQGHEFDGWFGDSIGFERQAKRGLVECPSCGDTKVERGLMAPAVPRKGGRQEARHEGRHAQEPAPRRPAPPAEDGTGTGVPAVKAAGGVMPAQVLAALQRMRAEVEKNCDYVGEDFAEEARKMHRGESERRGIYGETTQEQAESLAEDGIEVSRIPWVPRADG